MSTNHEYRYYEPEGDNYEDIESFIDDWVRYEMIEDGICDPAEQSNFYEAIGELNLREELDNFEQCTTEEKEKIVEYWENKAKQFAEEAYHDQ
jgi:hypothetical protein